MTPCGTASPRLRFSSGIARLRFNDCRVAAHRVLVGCCLVLAVIFGVAAEAREVVGWAERVQLGLDGEVLRAKVDTGADHSSLDARNIKIFRRDGRDWVRFERIGSAARVHAYEVPLVRKAQIRRHGDASQERPVVTLVICLGGQRKTAEVNLVDRSRFEYPMLIGRSFLGDDFLVDPAARFLREPRCEAGR